MPTNTWHIRIPVLLSTTVNQFVEDFEVHKGDPDNITIETCDMSLGFKKGVKDNFRNSQTIIDKFHVIKYANEAVDAVIART